MGILEAIRPIVQCRESVRRQKGKCKTSGCSEPKRLCALLHNKTKRNIAKHSIQAETGVSSGSGFLCSSEFLNDWEAVGPHKMSEQGELRGHCHHGCPHELLHTNRLYTNFIRYELFKYEPYPLRTFYITNFCRYELFTIRTLSHTNIWGRTFAYEHFPIWTLCLRTFVRLPTHSLILKGNSCIYLF